MNNALNLLTVGNEFLRQAATPVTNFSDPSLQQFIDALISKTISAEGVGIAAPQVGNSSQLFIVASHPNSRYPDAPKMEPTPMLNPRIISHSDTLVEGIEGCLSVPGKRGLVFRYQTIEVEYYNRYGDYQKQVLTDFIARIFQHELDHLQGILFIDRTENFTQGFTSI